MTATRTDDSIEVELVERARRRDAKAFELLYRMHVGRVFGLCLRMSADRARAEDLTQEAFIRAWQKLESFRGDSRFSTWLHELTVNVVLGDMRARSRRPVFFDVEPEVADTASARREPAMHRDLERAVAGLPPGARAVFVLHDVEGYRHEEIAGMADISVGTSKAQLHRARRLLRKALGS